jgi:hypothetical protein
VKVLLAEDGTRFDLVEIAGDQALIRVTGVAHEIAGKVLKHEITRYHETTRDRETSEYTTQLHGTDQVTLRSQPEPYPRSWTGYLRGRRDPRRLSYDDKKTKALDVPALLREHQQQVQSGALEVLQRFDRKAEEAKAQAELEERAASFGKKCGARPRVVIDWKGISDELIKSDRVGSCCGLFFEGVEMFLCNSETMRGFLKRVGTVRCAFGDRLSLKVVKNELLFTTAASERNVERRVKDPIRALDGGQGKTLGQLMVLEATEVCYANDKQVVILAPGFADHPGLSYGDGRIFFHERTRDWGAEEWQLIDRRSTAYEHGFFDPRQDFGGGKSFYNIYQFTPNAWLRIDTRNNTCELRCSSRSTKLKRASRAEVARILARAVYQPSPHQRWPHALARDNKGTYYYVDRGVTPETQRDFRIYIGPRGRTTRQRMKDIVADSEGEIYSTDKGDLRLVLGKAHAVWMTKNKKQELLWLPVQKNLPLIYNELGCYLGVRLGLPCDDL